MKNYTLHFTIRITIMILILLGFTHCESDIVSPENESAFYGAYHGISHTYSIVPSDDITIYDTFNRNWNGTATFNNNSITYKILEFFDETGAVEIQSLTEDLINYEIDMRYTSITIRKMNGEYINPLISDTLIIYDSTAYEFNFLAVFDKDTLEVDLTAPSTNLKKGEEVTFNYGYASDMYKTVDTLYLHSDNSASARLWGSDYGDGFSDGSWSYENDTIYVSDSHNYFNYKYTVLSTDTLETKKEIDHIYTIGSFMYNLGITGEHKFYFNNTIVKTNT